MRLHPDADKRDAATKTAQALITAHRIAWAGTGEEVAEVVALRDALTAALRAAFESGVAAGLQRAAAEADDGIIHAAREHIERLRGLLRDVAKWLHNRNIATRLIARIDAAMHPQPECDGSGWREYREAIGSALPCLGCPGCCGCKTTGGREPLPAWKRGEK